jgi:hypothetical protein
MGLTLVLLLSTTSTGVAKHDDPRRDAESAGAFIELARRATERFQNLDEAIGAGYGLVPGCVSGPEEGAMGVHYANGVLFGDGQLDAENPEVLVYEPRNGRLRLVAVEYVVPAADWHAGHPEQPVLLGQLFHYVGGPNRYGGAAFYELHVWAWKHNPSGTFADWNPKVSCADYSGPTSTSSAHGH